MTGLDRPACACSRVEKTASTSGGRRREAGTCWVKLKSLKCTGVSQHTATEGPCVQRCKRSSAGELKEGVVLIGAEVNFTERECRHHIVHTEHHNVGVLFSSRCPFSDRERERDCFESKICQPKHQIHQPKHQVC